VPTAGDALTADNTFIQTCQAGPLERCDMWHRGARWEFLTHRTTCTSEMSKKTTSKKICQKRPHLGGGMSGQATHGTCRLGQKRHQPATIANAGRWPHRRHRPSPLGQVGPVAWAISGRSMWPRRAQARGSGGPCRLGEWRHLRRCPDSPTNSTHSEARQ
jgi:hypothetical protein